MDSADLAREPDLPGRPERADADTGRRVRSAAADVDPGERGRAHDAAQAYADADATPATADTVRAATDTDAVRQDYRAEVPRFMRMWAEHQERWPATSQGSAQADRQADPEGSFRSDGGFYLSPERNAAATDAIGRIRAEEPAVSADLRTVERENTCGARLEGFGCRLKGDDRLKEKVAAGLSTGSPDATPEELLGQIPDGIRYTFCLEPGSYTKGYSDIKADLERCGHQMYQCRNSWNSPEYKGINTRWITQEGLRFEVQFHTPDSFHAKQHVTHDSYERLRNPQTSRPELRSLHAFQQEVSSHIKSPDGATDISDFKQEGL